MIGGVADLPLTGEEDQDVACSLACGRLCGQFLDRLSDPVQQILLLLRVSRVLRLAELVLRVWDLSLGPQGPVSDLHGKGAPGDFDDRRVIRQPA